MNHKRQQMTHANIENIIHFTSDKILVYDPKRDLQRQLFQRSNYE